MIRHELAYQRSWLAKPETLAIGRGLERRNTIFVGDIKANAPKRTNTLSFFEGAEKFLGEHFSPLDDGCR